MRDALRSYLAEPRVPDPPPPARRDRVLAGLMAVLVVVEVALRATMPLRWLSLVVGLALAPTLIWRRTQPLAMTAIVFGTFTLIDVPRHLTGRVPFELYSSGLLMLLPYALFRWGSGRDAARGFAIMMVPATMATAFDAENVGEAVGGFLVFFSVLAAASAVRFRTRARDRELEQVRLGERERLARDLHDTVAHHVSAIAIRAQAGLAVAPTRPDAALEALRVIETEASRTLAEMRTMVRYLRLDDPTESLALAPTPLIGDLPALGGDAPAGLRVEVTLDGAVDEVPQPVSTAIYRIAQESVTNARRHARNATRVAVGVTVDDEAVRLCVRDDGEPVPAHRVAPGFGLRGMVERAALVGGTCHAGPDGGRGWRVAAVVPRREAS